jgi:hypothetical protein
LQARDRNRRCRHARSCYDKRVLRCAARSLTERASILAMSNSFRHHRSSIHRVGIRCLPRPRPQSRPRSRDRYLGISHGRLGAIDHRPRAINRRGPIRKRRIGCLRFGGAWNTSNQGRCGSSWRAVPTGSHRRAGRFLVLANPVGQIRSDFRLCSLAKRAEPKLFARQRANRSLQIVHVPGGRECLCASGTIASRIEPLGARQGR